MKFDPRFTETIQMTAFQGSYVDGVYQKGASSTVDIIASVQRLSMRERQRLEEGFRGSETIKIYTEYSFIQTIQNNFFGGQIIDAAEFFWRGTTFDMIASEKWDYLIPHWKVTAIART